MLAKDVNRILSYNAALGKSGLFWGSLVPALVVMSAPIHRKLMNNEITIQI